MTEETLFARALEMSTDAERSAFLDQTCSGDDALRQRVEALLKSHKHPQFLNTPVVQRAARAVGADEASGEPKSPFDFLAASEKPHSLGRLGHYEIVEVIGSGGMGVVLRAFDEKLQRIVAIKVMAPSLASSAVARRRFSREAQAAAAVSHDHIVTIHAVEEANNPPYLVMQCVSGTSLQERLDKGGPMELCEILRIGMQTASGLAAAHSQGLVHRDIKPANILLENGVERVKITDFGLARVAADASLTQSGVVAGTPHYMSPEQAEGKAVDQRTDLFSLGSVLYAMCTGRAPFRASGTMAVLKRVCEELPTPIREANPAIPEWLVAIIEKLQAKEPAERFQSAAEVADLLGRHLAHLQQPSVASLPAGVARAASTMDVPARTPIAESRHATRRRRWLIAVALLACLMAGLSLSEATGVTQLTSALSRVFRRNGVLVVHVDDPGVKVTIEGDGGLKKTTGAGRQAVRLKPGSYRVQATKDGRPVRNEVVTIAKGDKQVLRFSMQSAETTATGAFHFTPAPSGPLDALDPAKIPEQERFTWQPKELVAVFGEHRQRHWGRVNCVAYSKDSHRIASGDSDDLVIRVWDAETMRELTVLRGHTRDVKSLVFSPDGERILSGSLDATMRLWDVETGKELQRFEVPTQVAAVAMSPDGLRALSSGSDGIVRLWDLETHQELFSLKGHTNGVSRGVAFSPDGRRALSGGNDNTLRLWDLEGRRALYCLEGHAGGVNGVSFSADGERALSCSISRYDQKTNIEGPAGDYDLRLWDLKEGKELRRFEGHTAPVWSASLSTDGRRAISCSDDATVRLWEVNTGKELQCLHGHAGPVHSVAFSPDGRRAVSGGVDGTVRQWDLEAGREIRPLAGPTGRAVKATFSADGRFVLVGGEDMIVRLWDVATGKEHRRFTGHTDPLTSVALGRDGRLALSGSVMRYWFTPQPADGDRAGPWLAWNIETGKLERRFPGRPNVYWNCVALSPDGRLALTGDDMVLWDVESGRELRRFAGHTGSVCTILFTPDGRRAISGSWDRTVRVWDVQSGDELACLTTVRQQDGAIIDIALSPDGRLVASAGPHSYVWLWDLTTTRTQGRSLLKWHTAQVLSVSFAPDGKTLASSGADGRIILWDVPAGNKLREWQLPGPVNCVTFAPDGRHLATANGNGTVYILRLSES